MSRSELMRVSSVDDGLAFYRDGLGHELAWRNDAIGQAGLRLPDGESEIVLTTEQGTEPNWLVESVPAAADAIVAAGGRVVVEPHDIPVGRLAVVLDPFDNALVLLDLSAGTYVTDESGHVTGVDDAPLRAD